MGNGVAINVQKKDFLESDIRIIVVKITINRVNRVNKIIFVKIFLLRIYKKIQ